ncbi:MAG: hypothetical protein EPO65_09605 [Dehalococcoidia bacterium]|nr:MAG: hypothetical protein EPO65_09605 [Dehalococcoidia bacterium]
MTTTETATAATHQATCSELGNALAAQQVLLSDLARSQTILVGGAMVAGELELGRMLDEPNVTVIESETARLQQAMRDRGCE